MNCSASWFSNRKSTYQTDLNERWMGNGIGNRKRIGATGMKGKDREAQRRRRRKERSSLRMAKK